MCIRDRVGGSRQLRGNGHRAVCLYAEGLSYSLRIQKIGRDVVRLLGYGGYGPVFRRQRVGGSDFAYPIPRVDVSLFKEGLITIPRRSRGFFTLGPCPSLLATRVTRLNCLSLAFTSACSLPTGSYQMAVARLIYPLVIGF